MRLFGPVHLPSSIFSLSNSGEGFFAPGDDGLGLAVSKAEAVDHKIDVPWVGFIFQSATGNPHNAVEDADFVLAWTSSMYTFAFLIAMRLSSGTSVMPSVSRRLHTSHRFQSKPDVLPQLPEMYQ